MLKVPNRLKEQSVLHFASMMLIEDEDEKDFREADLTGKRLFVTGLASTVDDVRLYLAFEPVGNLLEAHVVKPGTCWNWPVRSVVVPQNSECRNWLCRFLGSARS